MIDVDRFIAEQLSEWPQAADNYRALGQVQSRDIDMAPGTIMAQYNPARIVSTGAKVDQQSLSQRPCFLCQSNRPAQQRGLEWGEYTILLNPFPIFPRHLTIPVNGHHPQRIRGRVADMAALAAELPGYVIFYNGPKCGASAPDHAHFQAGNADFLPLCQMVTDIQWLAPGIGMPSNQAAINALPPMAIIEGTDPQQIADKFEQVYAILQSLQPQEDEPMLNALCQLRPDGRLRMTIIPRRQHRPDCYGHGDGQMLISPASVDLSGVIITPLHKDFITINPQTVKEVYRQVCIDRTLLGRLLSQLS